MHKDLCKGRPGLCDAMKPTKGAELLKYLRSVEFEGECFGKIKLELESESELNGPPFRTEWRLVQIRPEWRRARSVQYHPLQAGISRQIPVD